MGNCLVTPNPAKGGTTITVTATPESGYYTSSLYYMIGNTKFSITDGTFIMPAANITVYCEFGAVVVPPNPKTVYYATRDTDWNYCIGCCNNFIENGGEPNNSDEDLLPYIPNYNISTYANTITDITSDPSNVSHIFFQKPGGDEILFDNSSSSFLDNKDCAKLVACGLYGAYLSSSGDSSSYDYACLSQSISDMFYCTDAYKTFQYIEFAKGFSPVLENTVYNFKYAVLPTSGVTDPNLEYKDYIDRENDDDVCLFLINNPGITTATPFTYGFFNDVPIVFIDGISPNGSDTMLINKTPVSSAQADSDVVHNITWNPEQYYSYNGVQSIITTPEFNSLEDLLDPIVRHKDILRLVQRSAEIGSDLSEDAIIFSLGSDAGSYNLPSTYAYRFWLLGFGSGDENAPKLKLSLCADACHFLKQSSGDASSGAINFFDTYYDCIMQYNSKNYLVFLPAGSDVPYDWQQKGKEISCSGALFNNLGEINDTDWNSVKSEIYNPENVYYWSLYCEVVGQDSNIPQPNIISTVFRIDCERYFHSSLCHIVWQHDYNTFKYG